MEKQLNELGLQTIKMDNCVYVDARYISTVLDIDNINELISLLPADYVIEYSVVNKMGKPETISFITLEGLKRIVITSRKPESAKICEKICNIMNISVVTQHAHKDTEFIDNIVKSFPTETIIRHFPVLNYHLDAYFPQYNLVFEYDKKCDWKSWDIENITRQALIERELKCTFICFSQCYDIFDAIGKINEFINNCKVDMINRVAKINTAQLTSSVMYVLNARSTTLPDSETVFNVPEHILTLAIKSALKLQDIKLRISCARMLNYKPPPAK